MILVGGCERDVALYSLGDVVALGARALFGEEAADVEGEGEAAVFEAL